MFLPMPVYWALFTQQVIYAFYCHTATLFNICIRTLFCGNIPEVVRETLFKYESFFPLFSFCTLLFFSILLLLKTKSLKSLFLIFLCKVYIDFAVNYFTVNIKGTLIQRQGRTMEFRGEWERERSLKSEAIVQRCSVKKHSQKFRKIHRKIPVLESQF